MKNVNWRDRLAKVFVSWGETEQEARRHAAGCSKHGRQRTPPANLKITRRKKRKMRAYAQRVSGGGSRGRLAKSRIAHL